VSADELVGLLDSLPPWSHDEDISEAGWAAYVEAARRFRQTDPEVAAAALDRFVEQAAGEEFTGSESESKPFLLMRVLFELPEQAPESERVSFKGWTNWPRADERGQVSLSWPISWERGKPELTARYDGSAGRPYAASMEFRALRERFPYRDLE
jgi:hypothetical protein